MLMIVALIIVIPIAWYLGSPLFLDKTVEERAPENAQMILMQGTFQGAGDGFHEVSGDVKIISDGSDQYVRLENFQATNGPDLKVYLSTDLQASTYVSLGDLKGNIGDQNYLLTSKINFSEYPYVLIWCEPFSVLFGSARIS